MKRLILAGALLLAPSLAAAADVSGAWTLNDDFASVGRKFTVTCTFAVDNGKLSGPCKSDQGEATATGSVDGPNVEFGYDANYEGMALHLYYKGAVQEDGSIKGTIADGVADGVFTATKQ